MKKLIVIMVLVTSSLSAESLVQQVTNDVNYGIVNGAFPQSYGPGTKGFKKLKQLSQNDRNTLLQNVADAYQFFTGGTGTWPNDTAEQNRVKNILAIAGILLLSNSPQLAEKFLSN